MGWVIAIVGIVVLAVIAGLLWHGSNKPAPPPSEPPRPSRVTDATPMTGLEVALDQVTDRSGRNMREKIEGGTGIDDLRVPDDTGPILRRALDQVGPHPDQPGPPPTGEGEAASEGGPAQAEG